MRVILVERGDGNAAMAGPGGRVKSCPVTASSGLAAMNPALDARTTGRQAIHRGHTVGLDALTVAVATLFATIGRLETNSSRTQPHQLRSRDRLRRPRRHPTRS